MPATANIRKFSLSMVIIIAMITVLLPLCMAVSCGMGMDDIMSSPALGLNADCVTAVTGGAQAAITPGSQQSLILTLVVALAMALVFVFPPLTMRPLRAMAQDPPAPPEDPRGVRLII